MREVRISFTSKIIAAILILVTSEMLPGEPTDQPIMYDSPTGQSAKFSSRISGAQLVVTLVSLIAAILILSAFDDAGFYSDDAVMNNWGVEATMAGKSNWAFGWDQNRVVWSAHGRFSPGSFLINTPVILSIGENLFTYRFVHQAANLLAILSMFWLVSELTTSVRAGTAGALVMASMFCVTTYHDGLLSFGILMPMVLIFGSCGLASHLRAIRHPARPRFAVLAFGCATCSVLTYEFGMAFVAAHILLEYITPRESRRLTRLIAFLGLAIAFVTMFLLAKKPGQYEGTTVGSFDPAIVARAYLIQASGTIPLVAPLSNSSAPVWAAGAAQFSSASCAIALAVCTALYLAIGTSTITRADRLRLVAIGLSLYASPPLMTAMSAKYQNELSWGQFYLGGYVQFAGQALLVLPAIYSLNAISNRIAGNTLKFFIIGIISLSASVLWIWNTRAVDFLNQQWRFPRENLASALKAYRSEMSGTITVMVNTDWLARWENPNFLRAHSGVSGTFVEVSKATPFSSDVLVNGSRVFVSYPNPSSAASSVVIGQCSSLSIDTDGKRLLRFVPGSVRYFGGVISSFPASNIAQTWHYGPGNGEQDDFPIGERSNHSLDLRVIEFHKR